MLGLFADSMIARSLKIGLLSMMASTSFFSCTSGTGTLRDREDLGNGEEVAGPTFTTTLVLRDAAGTEKYTFQRTELITFELTVRNRTSQAVNVSLSTTQASDFYVFPNGGSTALWFCSTGMAFPTVVTTLTFAANETKVMQCTWNQSLSNGTFLPNGNYEARGLVTAVGVSANPSTQHELASTLRAFTVN
jgi:intracellular proteinase inhibitor BsuPI